VEMNPDPARPGERIRTEVTIGNHSGATLFNAKFRLRVPAEVGDGAHGYFDEDLLTGGGTCDLGNYPTLCESYGELMTWELGDLPAGAGGTLSLPLVVTSGVAAGRLISLEALLTADGDNQAVLEHTVIVDTDNALTLEVDESADPVVAGTQLTYTLTYGNRSPASVGSTVLTFPLPAGTTFVSASAGYTLVGGKVQWPVGTLGVGAGGFRQVKVAVGGGTSGTVLAVDAAELSQTGGTELARATAATRVSAAAIKLAVQIQAPNQPGNSMNTLFTITNPTNSELLNLRLQARVPAEVGNGAQGYFSETLVAAPVIWVTTPLCARATASW